MWEKIGHRINDENKNTTDFIFVTGCLHPNDKKKVKFLMRIRIEVLKTTIQSREVEKDPGMSYEIRGGSF